MSRTEIDRTTYDGLIIRRIAQLVGQGLDYIGAKQQALEEIERTFICQRWALQDELQKDRNEYNADMSLGGRPYKEQR